MNLVLALIIYLNPYGVGAAEDVSTQVVLRWQAVQEAVAYDLQVAMDQSFRTLVLEKRLKTAGYRWDNYPVEPHYWRVRSVDATGRHGPWSIVRQVTARLGRPKILRPSDGATLVAKKSSIDFVLEPYVGAAIYVVQIATQRNFRRIVKESRSKIPTLTVDEVSIGSYYWRAFVIDVSQRESPYTPAYELNVTVPPPRLLAPKRRASFAWQPDMQVEMHWRGTPGVGQWEIEILRQSTQIVVQRQSATTFVFQPKEPGRYIWLVRALGTHAVLSVSRPRSFFVGLAPPELLAPSNDATFVEGDEETAVFHWQDTVGAQSYVVEFASNSRFDSTQKIFGSEISTWKGLAKVPLGETWWRVRAIGKSGERGPPSEARRLRHLAKAPLQEDAAQVMAALTIPERLSGRLRLGLSVGWATNFGQLSSPQIHGDATWRTPLLGGHILAGVRAEFYRSASEVPVEAGLPESIAVRQRFTTLGVHGSYLWEIGPVEFSLGVASVLLLAYVEVGPEARLLKSPGVDALASLGSRLGPGHLIGDVTGRYARLDTELIKDRPGGLLLAVGYRLKLF
ncbi:MAG: hypothetical protein R3C68_14080 [Myxococcota bacterium]